MTKFISILAISAAISVGAVETESNGWKVCNPDAVAAWNAQNKTSDGIVVDTARREVRFLAESAGVIADDVVEFVAVGPLSDRAYESFAMTIASPSAIAAGLERVGVPRGIPVNAVDARFWPQGERLRFSVRNLATDERFELDDLLSDRSTDNGGNALGLGVSYTGGVRAADGLPVASTNAPCSVFALYNCGQSLLLLPKSLDQSASYGRFRIKKPFPRGTLMELSFAWDGSRHVRDWVLNASYSSNSVCQIAVNDGNKQLFSGPLHKALVYLHGEAAGGADIFIRLAFNPNVTVGQAVAVARAFSLVDGHGIYLNGSAEGQFFVQTYLPEADWRVRSKRLFQPFEVNIATNGVKTFTFVEEDWSGDGLDPVLKPRSYTMGNWSELSEMINKTGEAGRKINVLFITAPKSSTVGEITGALAAHSRISTFYIFTDVDE